MCSALGLKVSLNSLLESFVSSPFSLRRLRNEILVQVELSRSSVALVSSRLSLSLVSVAMLKHAVCVLSNALAENKVTVQAHI